MRLHFLQMPSRWFRQTSLLDLPDGDVPLGFVDFSEGDLTRAPASSGDRLRFLHLPFVCLCLLLCFVCSFPSRFVKERAIVSRAMTTMHPLPAFTTLNCVCDLPRITTKNHRSGNCILVILNTTTTNNETTRHRVISPASCTLRLRGID